MLEQESLVPTFTRKNLLGWMVRNWFGALGYIAISATLLLFGMGATFGLLVLASQAGSWRALIILVALIMFAASFVAPWLVYRFAHKRQVRDIYARIHENQYGYKADERTLELHYGDI